ncbi:MAG: site-specific DNA-methyltransferase [Candidatus Omnitrophica bacterium]|nr:site-specific DNA-methyltransferase [Candidatus Omnitrophota bacterium]MBU1785271.1 site-specific DNA-methyltransferase [Candidatus Omnitrophota bacterium]
MKVDVVYNKSSQRMDEILDGKVDCVLTSPPYYGLRDYGEDVREIWGGDRGCKHEFNSYVRPAGGGHANPDRAQVGTTKKDVQRVFGAKAAFCQKCGAWFGQLGLEPTFQLYLDHMMIVCAEVKRVLKKTGSFWLNMGDTYGGSQAGHGDTGLVQNFRRMDKGYLYDTKKPQRKIMPKCLLGIPSRLRNRLVDEQGWICRNTVIWYKKNSMPSSVSDRLSNSYEFLFNFVKNIKPQYCWNDKTGLMADRKPPKTQEKEDVDWEWRKCPRCEGTRKYENKTCSRCRGLGKIRHSFWHNLGYWYDLDAIREPYTQSSVERAKYPVNAYAPKGTGGAKLSKTAYSEYTNVELDPGGKNPGDVWMIATQSRPEAHFATFPNELCIKPILATCPAEICKKCGKARVRIVENKPIFRAGKKERERNRGGRKDGFTKPADGIAGAEHTTIGWSDCGCNAGWDSGILLDPFAGRGTSLIMAKKLGRHYVGYELSRKYCEKLIKPALQEIDPLFHYKEGTHLI